MKKIWLLLTSTLLFLTSCLVFAPQPTPTPQPIQTLDAQDLSSFKAGLNPIYHSIVDELSQASLYSIDYVIDDDLYHISGKQSVMYTNTEEEALTEIKFRLFANILGGSMQVSNITVDDEAINPTYELRDSVLRVPLKNALQPDDSISIKMEFEIEVPESVDLNYGVQAYAEDVLALAHAYPMISVYNDEGWNAEIPPQSGDVTFADMSFFVVTVDAPKEVVLVGSGRETSYQENGNRQQVRYEAGPVRDFYLVASPHYQEFVREVDGVTLRFYTEGDYEAGAQEALDFAEESIKIFNTRYAPYPYSELDFVTTPTLALGIEYPGMIAITEWIMEPEIGYLEATVAHEVAHQWFYNLVGNDQLDEPWLDESMAQFATLQYYEDRYAEEGRQGFLFELTSRWAYTDNAEIPVGLPVRAYDDYEYSGIVYGRGALFFIELEHEMGEENFDVFMKSYTMNNAWGISTTEKIKLDAEKVCGCDLTSLFKEWIWE